MSRINARDGLAITAGLVIVALTAAAFWLSYAHLAEVAFAHGMHGKEARAWAWPATLDLFIIAGELLMLRAALASQADPWAIGLTVAGSGGSIALNVAGVGANADRLDYVVAAVPPTAALLAFGALMRQVHQALAGRPEAAAEPVAGLTELAPELRAEPAEPITVERAPEAVDAVPVGPVLGPWRPVAELAGGTSGTSSDLLGDHFRDAAKVVGGTPAEPVPLTVPPTGTGAADIVSEDSSNTTFAKRVDTVRNWLQAEPDLTGTEIGTKLGVSAGYGRRLLRRARNDD
jgi:hypothetical protein